MELKQRKCWLARAPIPLLFLLNIKSKISNICVMQARPGSTGKRPYKPSPMCARQLLSLALRLTLDCQHLLEFVVYGGYERNNLLCFFVGYIRSFPQCKTSGLKRKTRITHATPHTFVHGEQPQLTNRNTTKVQIFSFGFEHHKRQDVS